jgi:hypothetical protein
VTFVSVKHVAGILPAVASLFGRSSRATLCQVGPESRVNHVESSREKPLDRHGALDKILRELSTVTGILWIPHLDATARPPAQAAQAASRTAVRWQEAIARGSLATAPPAGGPPAVETTFVGAVGGPPCASKFAHGLSSSRARGACCHTTIADRGRNYEQV